MTLRVSEIYPSYQGEGPNTGKPTTFVRFAGCNLKCPGWPCDTPHAIDPKIFTREQVTYTPLALAQKVAEYDTDNICLTGGEVFIQPIEDLECLLNDLKKLHTAGDGLTVEVFTNGTRFIPTAVWREIDTFILDWKLPGSGELDGEVYGLHSNLWQNIKRLGPSDAIKFTIKDKNDYEVAKQRYDHVRRHSNFGGVVYCGVVWEAIDTSELAGWMQKDQLPWRLNIQTHKYIWDPDARRT